MNIIMKLNEIAKEIRDIIAKRQQELNLTFEEDEHIYHMVGRNDFPSVSKVLKKFYKEFPAEEVSYKKANGDYDLQQQYLKEWSEAGTYSTNMGSRVHYHLEKELVGRYGNYKEVRQPIFECDLVQIMKGDAMISAGKKYLDLLYERGCVLLDTEMVMGDPDLAFVGQPDKIWLVENKTKTDFGFLITDYKTNKPKNFETTSWTEPMYEPFNNYPNTALGHYYLQLPLYGKLLLKMLKGSKYEDKRLYGCIIALLKEDGNFQEFRVPNDVISKVLDIDIQKYFS
jgi:hypothetical protein